MAYHCAKYYIIGLTIYKLPGYHNTKASTLYISHVYSQTSFLQHIPHSTTNSHLTHNLKLHKPLFQLHVIEHQAISNISIWTYHRNSHNTVTYIFIHYSIIINTTNLINVHLSIKSTTQYIPTQSQTILSTNSIIINNQDSSTSIYPYNLQSNFSKTPSHLFSCISLISIHQHISYS
jgi:hypothetical protein